MQDIKIFATVALTAIFAPMVIKYYTYLEYATLGAGATLSLVALGCVAYGGATMWLRLQEQRANVKMIHADVAYRQAEANSLSRAFTVVKAGEQVVMSDLRYPMQLVSHSAPHGLKTDIAQQLLLPSPVEADIMATIKTGGRWIEELLFGENGELKFFHVSINGPTGVGKTWLALYLASLLQQPHPRAEYWLLDPKFEGEESGWPFDPFVSDFEQMAQGVEYVYNKVVTVRKHNKRIGIMPDAPAFVFIDESDGCFDEHGDKFTRPVKRIIKEGRSGWVHCFMVGQSALVQDTGMNSSIFRNTCRFVLGNEAIAFTRNAQFTFWEKAQRDIIAKQLIHLQETRRRGVLVIPPSGQGLPFVGEIPDLPKPSFSQAADVEVASQLLLDANTMTYGEAKVVDDNVVKAMVSAYEGGKSVAEVARLKYSSEGTKQNVLTLRILEKAGVKLRSDDVQILAKGR